MSVKAQWHGLAPSESSGVDPFDRAYSVPMATIASPMPPVIDLSTPEPQLNARLQELFRREGNLFEFGRSCPMKDKGEDQGVCLACPVSKANLEVTGDISYEDAGQRLLCRIGMEQQTIVNVLRHKRHNGE